MNMLVLLPDFVFVLIVCGAAYWVSRRTMVDSALVFLATLLSSLLAITVFEPIAEWCRQTMFVASDFGLTRFLWFPFLIGIFCLVFFVVLNLFTRLHESRPEFGARVEHFGSWFFGVLSGYTLAALLLTSIHTLPVPRDYWGMFAPEAHRRNGPAMWLAPDYQILWLAELVRQPSPKKKGSLQTSNSVAVPPEERTLIGREHWTWLPVRYAIWREQLELFYSPSDDVSGELDDEAYTGTQGPDAADRLVRADEDASIETSDNTAESTGTATEQPNHGANAWDEDDDC